MPPKTPAQTVTRVARAFGISRTALLYYERMGVLVPSGRSRTGYRVYASADLERLREICHLRTTGLSLRAIRRALESKEEVAVLLHERLRELETEIEARRRQQRVIVGLLKKGAVHADVGPMNKARWSALLSAAGFSEDDMNDWHADFERTAPREHQAFLEVLLIPEEEIRKIRAWSRGRALANPVRRGTKSPGC